VHSTPISNISWSGNAAKHRTRSAAICFERRSLASAVRVKALQISREIRRGQPREPSRAIGSSVMDRGFVTTVSLTAWRTPANRRANRAKYLPLSRKPTAPPGPTSCRGLRDDFRQSSRDGCVDARDPLGARPRVQDSAPYEPVSVVEKIVREFTVVDLHAEPLDQQHVRKEKLRVRGRSDGDLLSHPRFSPLRGRGSSSRSPSRDRRSTRPDMPRGARREGAPRSGPPRGTKTGRGASDKIVRAPGSSFDTSGRNRFVPFPFLDAFCSTAARDPERRA